MARILLPTRKNPFFSILSPLTPLHQSLKLPKTLTMAVALSNSKRPTCPSCSKPSRLCLCPRIRNPGLENKVSVTILQHNLEKKHPLNSARIAKLGLKNVDVVTVSDVNFGARFAIRLLEPISGSVGWKSLDFDGVSDRKEIQKRKFDDNSSVRENVEERNAVYSEERNSNLDDCNGEVHPASCALAFGTETESRKEMPSSLNEALMEDRSDDTKEPVIFFTIGKHGVVSDVHSKWKLQLETHAQKGQNFDQILAPQVAVEALARGFTVKKLQRRQANGRINLEEYEEFEVVISPKSVLLFPSDIAVGVDDLQAMNIEVKSLIVLDGTWAKAKRMYKENPWLRLLPHLKLDLDKLSLYNEVRHQPRAGCLSTIESIVYSLKAVGDYNQGLDDLLNVFESMVGDQRRCKDERLSKSFAV